MQIVFRVVTATISQMDCAYLVRETAELVLHLLQIVARPVLVIGISTIVTNVFLSVQELRLLVHLIFVHLDVRTLKSSIPLTSNVIIVVLMGLHSLLDHLVTSIA
jgi:hypothetical protein